MKTTRLRIADIGLRSAACARAAGRLACLLTALVVLPAVHAQTKTGTTIGQFLLIEPSARAAAMGGTGVAGFTEVQSLYANPGALGHLDASGVQGTRMAYLADVAYNYAGVALKLGAANTLAFSLTYVDSGEMDVRTVDQPLGTGERFSVTNMAAGIGFSRRLTDRFSAGAQVQYVRENVWHSSLNAVSFNFGVLYRLPLGAYLGASLSNFGTRGQYKGRDLYVRFDPDPDKYGDNPNLTTEIQTDTYPLPILFRVGVGYPVVVGGDSRLNLAVDAYQPSDNTNSVSLGAEYSFRDLVALRGGYERLFQEDSEGGPTFGAGLGVGTGNYRLSFDYAWANHERLGNMQRFTLGFAF